MENIEYRGLTYAYQMQLRSGINTYLYWTVELWSNNRDQEINAKIIKYHFLRLFPTN